MFQKIAKHRANDASNDVHRPPLPVRRGHIVYLKFSNQGDLKYGTSFAKKCSTIKSEFEIMGK